jgi:hypothetical protein
MGGIGERKRGDGEEKEGRNKRLYSKNHQLACMDLSKHHTGWTMTAAPALQRERAFRERNKNENETRNWRT